MLEALVQPLKDVEDEDPVFNVCAEISQIVGHGLELAAVLIDQEVILNKSMKDSIKVKSTLLTVIEKLVKIRRDGVADPVEDDAIHLNLPWIFGRSVICNVLEQGIAL
jgi:hypothetical protein